MDGWTDGRYQVHYLPRFAVDKHNTYMIGFHNTPDDKSPDDGCRGERHNRIDVDTKPFIVATKTPIVVHGSFETLPLSLSIFLVFDIHVVVPFAIAHTEPIWLPSQPLGVLEK